MPRKFRKFTLDRYLEQYVNSIGLAVWRNMRYWMGRGYRYEDATKKAIPLGLGMLRAVVGVTISIEDAEIMFRDIASEYMALADILQKNRTNAQYAHGEMIEGLKIDSQAQ